MDSSVESIKKRQVAKLAIIASLGGFLFGYDTAIISGTIGFVTDQFNLDTVSQGWYVSSALIGTILGVACAGVASDKFGRKFALLCSAILFGISAVGCMFAGGFHELVIYRLLGGIGVGIASMLSPLYISEIAPAKDRGRLVALYQLAITVGILLSYFANALFLKLSLSEIFLNSSEQMSRFFVTEVWRIMLGSEILPAIVFLLLLLIVPQSPRWLVAQGKKDEAKAILLGLASEDQASHEISEISDNLAQESGGLKMIFGGGFKLALYIGVSLAFLTQVSGINAIIYYGPTILEEAGLKLSEALGGQVIIGIVNVLFTLVALWKIDKLGRLPLLLFGVIGIITSLFTIGLLFYLQINNTYLLMLFILTFIACFAFSYGPVVWVLLSEIYPLKIRGTAMSIATISLWSGTALVGQLTPWFLENLKAFGTFWFFALCTLPALYLALKVIPETKGKSLEEIERFWLSKK